MKRRDFLTASGATIVGAATLGAFLHDENFGRNSSINDDSLKLTPPQTGKIPVAVVISKQTTLIDFAGPWEAFYSAGYVHYVEKRDAGFDLYTVAETLDPVSASGGLKVVPNFTFANAPTPKVVLMGAQSEGDSPAKLDWIKKMSQTSDVVMSVCTGAFILARTGLIDGKTATTHHNYFDSFAKQFPNIELKRGLRFVEEKKFSSSGGLTSGIDLALRIVDRYYGRDIAQKTADYMEYQSKSWIV